jgi:hypothetical protein
MINNNDCRSVHAASIQLKNSRQMGVPWFGLKWEDEKIGTIEIREEEKKRKKPKRITPQIGGTEDINI